MKNKKYIVAPDNCTGCALCSNVCSHNAIQMVWSNEGFLIPKVDTNVCINCGLCVKKCIALEEKKFQTTNQPKVNAYGSWNRNENIQFNSSSGGVFSAIAENILMKGGCVYGVIWKDKLTAAFSKATNIEDLKYMRGSKYTPAIPNYIYRDVLTELKLNKPVLFSGTPCQVYALKKYLRRDYDNLITIDIVCHGTPSHLLLEKYILEQESKYGKTIHHVSFREKPDGWLDYHVTCHYEDNTKSSISHKKDIFMDIFLSDKALNKCCYNCAYSHIPRQGDITLGDYWGVEKQHDSWPVNKGISAIIANNDKGKELLHSLTDIDFHSVSYDEMIKAQPRSYGETAVIQIYNDRPLVLSKLKIMNLRDIMNKIIKTAKLGPFRIKRDGLLYKLLKFLKQ